MIKQTISADLTVQLKPKQEYYEYSGLSKFDEGWMIDYTIVVKPRETKLKIVKKGLLIGNHKMKQFTFDKQGLLIIKLKLDVHGLSPFYRNFLTPK